MPESNPNAYHLIGFDNFLNRSAISNDVFEASNLNNGITEINLANVNEILPDFSITEDMIDQIKPDQLTEGYLAKTFTADAALSQFDAVYVKSSDGDVAQTDASFSDERITRFVGFVANEAVAANNDVTVIMRGVLSGFSLTAGKDYFISDTAGEISSSPGTNFASVGFAVSDTELLIGSRFALDEASDDIGLISDGFLYIESGSSYVVKLTFTLPAGSFYNISKIEFELKGPTDTVFCQSIYNIGGAGDNVIDTDSTGSTSFVRFSQTTTAAKNTDKDDNVVIKVQMKSDGGSLGELQNIKIFGTRAIRI